MAYQISNTNVPVSSGQRRFQRPTAAGTGFGGTVSRFMVKGDGITGAAQVFNGRPTPFAATSPLQLNGTTGIASGPSGYSRGGSAGPVGPSTGATHVPGHTVVTEPVPSVLGDPANAEAWGDASTGEVWGF